MLRRLCWVSLIFALPAPAQIAMFDGQSLAGWHGDARVWRAEDGCLVGSTAGLAERVNTYLFWDGGAMGDFDLEFEAQLEGDNNSGVQYRSRELPGLDVAGYQCDLHGAPEYFGMVYEDKGAGVLCRHGEFLARAADGATRVVGQVATPQPVELADWHAFRVVARGNLIQHFVDGALVAMLMDDARDAPRTGVFALQVHGGTAMTVRFRNLRVTPRAAEEVAALPPVATALLARERQTAGSDGPVPQWIWDASADGDEDVFFRREFEVAGEVAAASLVASCDNGCRVYVNGARVAEGRDWAAPVHADAKGWLVPGRNVIAVHGWNEGGPAALALRLSWTAGDTQHDLVTDATWHCLAEDPDGWNDLGFESGELVPVTALGAVGSDDVTWTSRVKAEAFAAAAPPDAPQVALPAVGLSGPGAFGALELLAVPRAYGSWVALGADDRGRLYASDQSRGLYRITPAGALGELSTIEKVDVDLDGAQGLCWFRGALYAVVSVRTPGLYRVTDTDGDDRLDRVELLRKLGSGGEHGPHAVMPHPDGENLLIVIGNHVPLTEVDAGMPRYTWGEDRLLPKFEDPRGHAVGLKAPGGYACKVDPDGQIWQLICWGFRNTYDLAVLPDGTIYGYDADMEWDMGLPWYRPTRILEIVAGADYGWRSGSNKWPADYPDSPQAVCDIGPGSPTGMVVHGGSVLALDWTFGTIYALPIGSREPVQWVTGQPFPVSDAVSLGGHLYVITGGRGLRSRLLRLDAAPPAAVAARAPAIAGPSPMIAAIRVALASGGPTAADELLGAFSKHDIGGLAPGERITWLRQLALTLLGVAETGTVADAQRAAVAACLLPHFPTGDERVDQDMAEILAFVDAPGLLDKAVPLLTPLRPSAPPAWAEVATRNASYGGAIQAMLANMPPAGQLALAYALCRVEHGWTLDQRRALFEFLAAARQCKGGASYDGYLQKMIDAAWETCTPAEQNALAEVVDKARAELPKFRATPPAGPGRSWQLADAQALVEDGLAGRDLARGHNLFHAIGCASCHYFAGEGGNHGPDLTSLGNKFAAAEVLEAILLPDKVISDQYSASVVTRKDGSTLLGRAARTTHDGAEVWQVVTASADGEVVFVPVDAVASVEPSPRSPMPNGLLDALNPDELRDLVAFLLSRGVR